MPGPAPIRTHCPGGTDGAGHRYRPIRSGRAGLFRRSGMAGRRGRRHLVPPAHPGAHARRLPCRRHPRKRPGYVLTESLAALALAIMAMLPLAGLSPHALQALRHAEAFGAATRAAVELIEADAPERALPPLQGAGVLALRSCDRLDSLGCAAGHRLAVARLARAGLAPQDMALVLWSRP